MSSKPSLIIVEDEADLREAMCGYLERLGFDVRGAESGPDFDRLWRGREAAIVVLDVNLPGESGFSIATRIRVASPGLGIIMLTARSHAEDRIAGLELGVDNYLVKPVILRELEAAINTLSRRLAIDEPEDVSPQQWIFDRQEWSLVAPNGIRVALTAAEFSLMSTLAECPGTSVSAGAIMEALGKVAIDTNRRSLDSVLSRLRRKIEEETGVELPIRSVRSVGYVFASPLCR